MGKVAESIAVSVTAELDSLVLRYKILFSDGDSLEDELIAKYSLTLNFPFNVGILKNYFMVFLSQMFLSVGDIVLTCSRKDFVYYQKISDLLYNIRNYQEGTDYYPKSYIFFDSKVEISCKSPNCAVVMNMISGGKDSLVSDFLLQENGAKICRCFISGLNVASDEKEKLACQQLYREYDTIELQGFDRLVNKLVQISDCYGCPPKQNFIPKGRDILSVALVYPLAVQRGCSYISHGCEKDLWENNIEIDGKYIPTHDSQSKLVIEPMGQQLELATGIGLFSPLCGMHEIYILTWLMKNHPSKVKLMQSCFYDSWCGKCSKCLRYFLIEKSIGASLLDFQSDPSQMVDAVAAQLKDVNAEKEVRYYKELSYLLGNSQYYEELFTPVFSSHFPQFFRKWDLG